MATCQSLETIVKPCDNNIGGIYGVWINTQDEIASITPTDPSIVTGANAWQITGIALNSPGDAFQPFEVRRNTSNYTEDSTIDLVNGSSFVTQTVNLVFHRRDADKSRAIKILGTGQQYLVAIILDANGLYWYFPYLQLSATGEGSGTARADGSKYTVTLVAENPYLAYNIDMSVGALAAIGVQ
jgi:hypothetical protein